MTALQRVRQEAIAEMRKSPCERNHAKLHRLNGLASELGGFEGFAGTSTPFEDGQSEASGFRWVGYLESENIDEWTRGRPHGPFQSYDEAVAWREVNETPGRPFSAVLREVSASQFRAAD